MDLRAWRLSKGWRQVDLAAKAGVDVTTVGRWERGERQPYAYNLERLYALGFSPSLSPVQEGEQVPQAPVQEGEQTGTGRTGVAALQPTPRVGGEHPSTYFVQDRSSQLELARLINQDQMMTDAVGGVLPEQADPSRFKRVLDVGCGTGGWLTQLAREYPSIESLVGVDISGTMLAYARQQASDSDVGNRLEFRVMDALRMLEFPDKTFDLVNLRFGISFMRHWDWPKLVQELKRVTCPGGIVRITDIRIMTSTSAALNQLWALGRQAALVAGFAFGEQETDSMPAHLCALFEREHFQDIHLLHIPVEYHAGSVAHRFLVDDMARLFRLAPLFWQKWINVPDEVEDIYQHMLLEMKRPDFRASWPLFILWGTVR